MRKPVVNESEWRTLCGVDRGRLSEARLQAHHAVQWLACAARAFVPPQPDDNHTNLGWDGALEGFTTHPLKDDLRLGLRLPDLSIALLGNQTASTHPLCLSGRADAQARHWLTEQLGDARPGRARTRPAVTVRNSRASGRDRHRLRHRRFGRCTERTGRLVRQRRRGARRYSQTIEQARAGALAGAVLAAPFRPRYLDLVSRAHRRDGIRRRRAVAGRHRITTSRISMSPSTLHPTQRSCRRSRSAIGTPSTSSAPARRRTRSS